MTDPQQLPDLISAGVSAAVDQAKDLHLSWNLRLATVTTVSPLTIQYDGDSERISATSIIGDLFVGERVYGTEVPPGGQFIIGAVNPYLRRMGTACGIAYTLPLGNTTSAVPVPMPGPPAVRVTKYQQNTQLKFDFAGTFFSSVADAGPTFSAHSGSIDIAVAILNVNNGSFNLRQQVAGHAVAILPAGAYTFEGWWKRTTGGGTLNVTPDDTWMMCVTEFLP